MRVFISWSGEQSRQIAEILRDWLPNIMQDLTIYVSSQDIASGERWANSVNKNLEEHQFGISVVTEANVSAPWILFEAGSLAKSVGGSSLIPVLCGIKGISITNHPLLQFQYVVAPDEVEMLKLVTSLNAKKDRPLPDDRLKQAFSKWFPDFLEEYKTVDLKPQTGTQTPKVSTSDLIPVMDTIMRELRDLRGDIKKQQSISQVSDESATSKLLALAAQNRGYIPMVPPDRAGLSRIAKLYAKNLESHYNKLTDDDETVG